MKKVFPDREQLLPHQQEIIDDGHRFKVIVWHRRARKTTTAITELTRQALRLVGAYWCVFPTYSEAKDAVWRDPNMLFRIIPPEAVKKRNEQELVVYLENGSYIQLKGSDDPDTLRGADVKGLILDEFATMKVEAWQVIEPILRANNGWAWFIGTPKGKNHLHDFYIRGQEDDEQWKSWHLKASQSGIIDQYELNESKKSMSESFFNQEWECEWLEGEGSVFRNVRGVCNAIPKRPEEGHSYVIGCDLAKLQNYTVMAVYDKSNNSQVYQDRFRAIEWTYQKKKIAALSKHYNNALVLIDATGLGDPIADDLLRAGVPIEPYKFTETTKKELIEKHSIWIEQGKMHMLPLDETILEHENFTYTIGETGKVKYGAPTGQHDDIVIAHALAVHLLQPIYRERIIKPPSMIRRYYEKAKANYEGQRAEEYELDEWSRI